MELTNDVRKQILKNKLEAMEQEEYSILVSLEIAVEVKNESLVKQLQPQAEMIRKSINALKKRIEELDTPQE